MQSYIIRLLENFEKIAGFPKLFVHSYRKVFALTFIIRDVFLLSYCLMVW